MSIDTIVSTVKNNYIFVAYYTRQTGYETTVKTLRASLDKFNLQYFIDGIPTRGSWQSNIAYKPEFVFAMLCKFPDKDIIYVDADAELKQYPIYFDTFYGDIGVHFKDGKELLSGTIYLRNNERVRDFVRHWMSTQQHYPNTWDQVTLHRTIGKYAKELGIKVVDIPAAYTQIFDSMKHHGAPVIEHHQASRKLKTLVNRSEATCYPNIPNIRKYADGTFGIPRRNAAIEEIINKDFVRFHNELRWYPAHPCGNKFECLRPIFSGKPCYIIGKGPSLDRLTADYFDRTSPILAVNESIHKVESLNLPNPTFMMQQDTWLKESCRPKKAGVIIAFKIREFYRDITERYVFIGPELGAPTTCLTATYGIYLGKKMKSTNFIMCCFDACMPDTMQNINRLDYAKCVGVDPTTGGDPQRFLKHRRAYDIHLRGCKIQWILPS